MSIQAMTWVMYESESTGNDRLVLLAIADEADDDGLNAFPGTERIALKARVNRATVTRAIVRLEERGELLILRPKRQGRGHHNRYALTLGRPVEEVADLAGWVLEGSQPSPVSACAQPVDEVGENSTGSVAGCTPSGPENARKGRTGAAKGLQIGPKGSRLARQYPSTPGPIDPRRPAVEPTTTTSYEESRNPAVVNQRRADEARARETA